MLFVVGARQLRYNSARQQYNKTDWHCSEPLQAPAVLVDHHRTKPGDHTRYDQYDPEVHSKASGLFHASPRCGLWWS